MKHSTKRMQKLLLLFNLQFIFVNIILAENLISENIFNATRQQYIRRRRPIKVRTTTQRIVLVEAPVYSYKNPECSDYNEIWSDQCELYCQHQQISFGQEDRRCRRSVNDIFAQNYINQTFLDKAITTDTSSRESRKRKKDKNKKKDKNELLIELIEEETKPIYDGKHCVCKRKFARLDGRCVPFGQCPGIF